MKNPNSKESLLEWANIVLKNSPKLSKEQKSEMYFSAHREATYGGLRGDISDTWKKEFSNVTVLTVPDLYI